jgi:hypothetical protein
LSLCQRYYWELWQWRISWYAYWAWDDWISNMIVFPSEMRVPPTNPVVVNWNDGNSKSEPIFEKLTNKSVVLDIETTDWTQNNWYQWDEIQFNAEL